MAVSFDVAAVVNTSASSSSITVNLTIGGTANFLVGKCSGYTTQPNITSMVWNGTETLTPAVAAVYVSADDTQISTRANPTTGAHSLVVNFSPNTPYGAVVTAESYIGVAAAGNTNTINGAALTSPESLSITVASGGMATDSIAGDGLGGDNFVPGSGQTPTFTPQAFGGEAVAASYKADATAMVWTWSGGVRRAAHAVLELTPAAAGGPSEIALERGTRGIGRGVARGMV